MGINGLLPLLKSIQKPCSLKKFEGKTLGVDAYGWLHRGTVACAMELAMGKPSNKYVDFCMHRVRMLLHYGVTPYLIFDGDYLPSKAATEEDRAKRRESSRKMGMELYTAGKTAQAYLEFQKAVDVTPEMACQVIEELNKIGVRYIVAPYEADAQMVYLERKGIIHGILSEDSDLLVFGAKCLLTKLDQYGNCIEVNKADFCAVKDVSLTGWSDAEFRRMAILSGCDYLASINNMGLKTAHRLVRKHKTIEKVLKTIHFEGKLHVPKGYLEDFHRAETTFLHQRVFCPEKLSLVFHVEPQQPIDEDQMPYIGALVDPEIAQGVASGRLNPITKAPIVLPQKSNMMRSTQQWATPKPHLQRSVSLGDAMKGKSIEHYFGKPKRTPLAELDINCFTPSPSQADALRRNSGPWSAAPAPRPYLHQATIASVEVPHSEPPPNRSHARQASLTASSETRASKRVRLCEDSNELPALGQKMESGRSRFFGSAISEQSPMAGKHARNRRTQSESIEIFSDDSVEDVMLNLPDFDGSSAVKSGKKISIFQGESVRDSEGSNGSQSTVKATPPKLAQLSSSSSSVGHSATRTALTVADTGLKEKFGFSQNTPPTSSSSALDHEQTTPPLSPRMSKIPLPVKANSPKKTMKSTLTPLQRIGLKAASRALPFTPPMTPLPTIRPNAGKTLFSQMGGLPFPEVRKKKIIVEAASVPLPVADEAEKTALNTTGGSEDLIIHDSEEDEDEERGPEVPALNLRRFVYAA